MKKILLFLVIFLPCVIFARGENTGGFVNIPQGARQVGMAGAFVGIADDSFCLYYNPAGISSLKTKEILGAYTKWFADIGLGFFGYAQPMSKNNGLGISLTSMNTKGGDEASDSGKTGKELSVECMALAFSYSQMFSQMALGGSIKSIHQDYAGYRGSKICLDLGSLIFLNPDVSLGLSLNNIGSDMEIDNVKNSLPFNIKAGLGYKMAENVLFAFDVEKPNDSSLIFKLGTEYKFLPNIDVRGGYNSLSGYSIGFGIRSSGRGVMKNLLGQIDYAYLYNPDLNHSHRVSLLTRF
ncbi:MAG: PorV/PorQ family protein [bacterium]